MPLCGFNEKMLQSLTLFSQGLYEQALIEKKQRKEIAMPMCGFNKKMLEGLKSFSQGLVEHGIQFRAQKNSETTDQAIKREISDLTRLLAEIHRIDDSAKRILTQGLVKYALGFYLLMRKNKTEDYKKVIEGIAEYFHFMDDKYYSELEGKPDDMEKLAKLLNEKQI